MSGESVVTVLCVTRDDLVDFVGVLWVDDGDVVEDFNGVDVVVDETTLLEADADGDCCEACEAMYSSGEARHASSDVTTPLISALPDEPGVYCVIHEVTHDVWSQLPLRR